jgi:hypothetical protein
MRTEKYLTMMEVSISESQESGRIRETINIRGKKVNELGDGQKVEKINGV